MAPRATSSATLYFGLVPVRVKLFTATNDPPGISFTYLHKDCGAKPKQQYLCERHNSVLERDAMVKGYEVSKDRFVVFEPDELKAIEETPSPVVDVIEYVGLAAIDPLYFDKPYNLAPEAGSEKAYALFVQALLRKGRVGLGLYSVRGKQLFVMVRSTGERLVLQQLLRDEQVRPVEEVEIEKAPVREPELKLALELVEKDATDTFDPGAYPDQVRERTLKLIEQKVAGKKITIAPPEDGHPAFLEVLEALKASLARKRPGPRRAVRAAPAARAHGTSRK